MDGPADHGRKLKLFELVLLEFFEQFLVAFELLFVKLFFFEIELLFFFLKLIELE